MPTKTLSLKTEPKYSQLARHLREQAQSDGLKPDDHLPSYPEMKARGIGQETMERAQAVLERKGLIERRDGRDGKLPEYSPT